MAMRMHLAGAVAVAAVSYAVQAAHAGSLPGSQYYLDWSEWQAAAGEFTTIDFTGFDAGTIITDQYANEGVTFFNGIDTVFPNPGFLNDGWGLDGNGDIWVQFDEPMHWVGADWPGFNFQIDLYSDGTLLTQNPWQSDENIGNFLGLHSPEAFDVAVFIKPTAGDVFVDDIYFAVPAPAGAFILLLPLAHTSCRRARRRRLSPGMDADRFDSNPY